MQDGQIYRIGNCWMLRYYEPVLEGGKVVNRRRSKKIATYGDEYRTKADVGPLAKKILAPINAQIARPQSGDTVLSFIEDTYLPYCVGKLRPSTAKCYSDMFKYLKPHVGDIRLGDFRTVDADKLLKAATADKQRAHTTHRNMKIFLSSAFRHAKRTGAIDGQNPVRDAEIPRGKPKGKRPAYTLDEVSTMLKVLPEPSRTVVLTAALTGLRSSELKGLRWEDFDGDSVLVQRGVWQGKVSDTKTLASASYVPVVPELLEALAEHRERNSGKGWVFHGATGNPLRIDNNLVRDQMKEPLKAAGIRWRGWHPFRYGVGTTLRSLGVDIKLIQQILRHTDQGLTAEFYIKPPQEETHRAMMKLEKALGKSLRRKTA